ncbi:DUF2867 domain-containing protein [Hydrogenophaga sp. RWCD_12]|uniref:DUF2867 domain-containing protein n=1 Tax=Hydrogenophaga sp. RWCD_12 TaxID=3391190 RepID=UPI00398553B6
MNTPTATQPPAGSRIAGRIAGADFHDAWSIDAADPSLSALGQFLKAVQTTPRWVETCMTLRNRAVQLVGLKNLGELSEINPAKPDADYQPGDRVGIFTLFEKTPDEVLLGDRDKHLDVVLSVHCDRPAGQPVRVTVTTVVHTKNRLGRLYMLPVKPMHKLIAPTVLRAIGAPARVAA